MSCVALCKCWLCGLDIDVALMRGRRRAEDLGILEVWFLADGFTRLHWGRIFGFGFGDFVLEMVGLWIGVVLVGIP